MASGLRVSRIPGLVNKQFAIEAMAIEIVDLPINSMIIFHSYVNVYQRVLAGGKYVTGKKNIPFMHVLISIYIYITITVCYDCYYCHNRVYINAIQQKWEPAEMGEYHRKPC